MARASVLLIRGTLWAAKGLLGAVALGALVAWPWSYGHAGTIRATRWTVGPELVEDLTWLAGCGEGRVSVGGELLTFSEADLSLGREVAAADGATSDGLGWNFHRAPGFGVWSG